MKKLIFATLAAALCSCGGSNFTIMGQIGLAPGDSVFLFGSDQSTLAAGVIGPDSTFTLQGHISMPDDATLNNRDKTQIPVPLLLEAGAIRIEPDSLEAVYNVWGTPLNDSIVVMNKKMLALREEYLTMTAQTPREEVEALMERFNQIPSQMISANLDNVLGLKLFSNYEFPSGLQDDSTAMAAMKARMDTFSPAMQAHPIMQRLHEQLAARERIQLGKPFVDLELENTAGQLVSLSSLTGPGHWVLLDFWATWCGPCKEEIPYLKKAYAAYKELGFEIYAVSLDADKSRWQKYVAEEGMSWINLRGDRTTATTDYCILSIPTNYLISPEGILIAKNLRGEDLEAKLAEVMK